MARKILIIGPAWVGDMIMAQSLFIDLKRREPDCMIDVVAPKSTVALVSRMPEVRRGIALNVGHGELNLKARKSLAKELRAERYDQAIILTNSFKSALIPWFAKIKRRTSWLGESRYILINDVRKLDKEKYPLMIERFLMLAGDKGIQLPDPLPWPRLSVNEALQQAVLNKLNINLDKKVLALCPGAEYGPAKRWPAEYYAEVAKAKIQEGWQVWIFGGPKDQSVAADIQSHCANGCVDLTGKTSLLEAIDLLSCAGSVVTNDSGLMHVSAAVDRRIVAIYGSSSPKFTPPLSDKVLVLSLNLECSPCFERECPLGHLNCLKQLLPEKVLRHLD